MNTDDFLILTVDDMPHATGLDVLELGNMIYATTGRTAKSAHNALKRFYLKPKTSQDDLRTVVRQLMPPGYTVLLGARLMPIKANSSRWYLTLTGTPAKVHKRV